MGIITAFIAVVNLNNGANTIPARTGNEMVFAQAPLLSFSPSVQQPDTVKRDPDAPLKIACPEDVST